MAKHLLKNVFFAELEDFFLEVRIVQREREREREAVVIITFENNCAISFQ